MKIVAFSDTHSLPDKHFPRQFDGDVLVCAGDFTLEGEASVAERFAEWLAEWACGFTYGAVLIAGNHDLLLDRSRSKSIDNGTRLREQFRRLGIHYLEDESIALGGLKFYGSPWTPRFGDWAFMKERGLDIAGQWAQIPDDTDVLITHGPPENIWDTAHTCGAHLGCRELRARISHLPALKLHVFGHIHGSGGGRFLRANGAQFANVAVRDEGYRLVRGPQIFTLPDAPADPRFCTSDAPATTRPSASARPGRCARRRSDDPPQARLLPTRRIAHGLLGWQLPAGLQVRAVYGVEERKETMSRDLCESAKKGRVCCDDLCRGGGLTLCGFDKELHEELTRDDEDDDEDPSPQEVAYGR